MIVSSVETVTVTGAGLTISRLIWNRFQRPMPGVLAAIYDQNPGIAEHGSELPIGLIVMLPIPEESDTPDVQVVNLWN